MLMQELKSPENLENLFSSFESLFARSGGAWRVSVLTEPAPEAGIRGSLGGPLDGLSPLGLFLRRSRAEFHLMSFEAVTALWADIHKAVTEATRSGQAPPSSSSDNAAQHAGLNPRRRSFETGPAAGIDTSNDGERGDAFAKLRFTAFITAVQHRDYTAALDNLHSYFDYTGGLSTTSNSALFPSFS